MASLKKKSVVSKDDLKRLMKQSAIQKTERKIESPLAKYDSVGNLYCALCSSKVKNNLHWKAHVQSRTHKQNLEDLKVQAERKQEATVAPPSDLTRKRPSTPPADGSLTQNKKRASSSQASGRGADAAGSLQLGGYGSSSDSESDEADRAPSAGDHKHTAAAHPASASTALPTDFFDTGVVASKPADGADEEADIENEATQSMAEKIPEGFFDDPKLDAKAREVKYVDKEEEEWERFQRAIKEENIVSEQIQEEDEEEKQAERNVKEIDEHIYHWQKVEELHEQKEKVMTGGAAVDSHSDVSANSDLDEKEYEEFLDWRTKTV